MELSRWFPMTSWVWRRRMRIVGVTLLIISGGLLTLASLDLAYIFRANRALRLVTAVRLNTYKTTEATLKRYCPVAEIAPTSGQLWVCSKGDILHPYLRTAAYFDTDSSTHEPTGLGLEILVRRTGYEPLAVEVWKNLRANGSGARFHRRPDTDLAKGVTLYLERDAEANLHVNYKCALPFVKCVLVDDLISH